MSYNSSTGRSDDRPRTAADAAAPRWPVLARLPWVDESSSPQTPPGSYAEFDDAPSVAPPSLRVVSAPNEPARAYVDRPHQTAGAHIAAPRVLRDEPATIDLPTPQRHHRYDPGSVTPAFVALASPSESAPTEGLANRMFQWHAALAPHAGVVVTFLLAMTAGLLYWAAFGQPAAEAPAPLQIEPARPTPLWTSESLDPTTLGLHKFNSPPSADDPVEFTWSRRDEASPETTAGKPLASPADEPATKPEEAVAAPAPKTDETLAAPATVKPEAPAAETAVAAALQPPPASPGAVAQAAPAAAPPAGTSPAPAASAPSAVAAAAPAPYPITPYAALDFGLLVAPPESAPPADSAVAELPAGAAAAQQPAR